MYDVRRLQTFVSVVELGSVTAAADELLYTPSAVSQQLKKLEAEVGLQLLWRTQHGLEPTEAGLILAEHTRRILRQLKAAQSDISDLTAGRIGKLSIGAFPTVAASFLPLAIDEFKRRYPSVNLQIRSARLDKLVQLLEEGTVQMSLLWDYPWEPFSEDGISTTEIYSESFAVLVSKDHPLASFTSVSFEQLKHESWVTRGDDHPVVEVIERSGAQAGFRPNIAMYANDYQETQAMVSVGIGIAIAPRSALSVQHPNVQILDIGENAPQRRILLGQREERSLSPLELAFKTVLVELGSQFTST
ncbi:LysR family transcriptional regulator [Corynebacterium glutamicum]|uniref:LysR family transcriptional regulator n=1 Tax=Corynebacterium glutamicum TaxID=1718 RepID=UPI000744BE77|nr:LysR family transcriptional regulator [Corynebacterium glutamicum]AMA01377.1 LysR family transcriptional regulator [Corynebacterium glutamicum]